jgi:hypothetical protein
MLTLALTAILLAPVTGTWDDQYRKGVLLVEQGQGAEARRALESAVSLRPEGGLRIQVGGASYVDYLPHLYLAMACQMTGDLKEAREQLAAAEKDGLATRSEIGKPLLEAYRLLLGSDAPVAAPPEPTSAANAPKYAVYPRKPVVLADEETAVLRAEVLARCQLRPDTRPQDAPWYFHYELGRDLVRRGDAQRGLDALIEAATRRDDPSHGARVYGMWFMDYLPYFEIAKAHAYLNNWDCARNALEYSKRAGEIQEKDKEFAEFRELMKKTEAKK